MLAVKAWDVFILSVIQTLSSRPPHSTTAGQRAVLFLDTVAACWEKHPIVQDNKQGHLL